MTFLFLTRMTLRSRDLFFLVTFILLSSVFASAQLVEDPFCGYAPLCGSANVTIELSDDVPPDFPTTIGDAVLFGGAEIDLLDCCSLRDTAPVRDCEVVDPTGTGQRYATISQSLCDAFESVSGDENACDFGDCSNFAIILRPTFIGGNEPDGCCDTCSCYGDPQCTSFDGTKKMWRLCDGREVPPTGASWEHCRTTKDVCDTQKDHAGNTCAYLASNEDGKDWNLVKKGSPCVPNPLSPPSVIDMYSVPNADFGLSLTQGERGIILSLTLKLQMGTFRLSAVDCLTKHKNAWEFDEDEVDSTTLPPAFAYSKLVETEDIMWDIIDPHSGIAVNIRCYGNSAKGADVDDYPGGVYVPRLNVESLADPVARRRNTHGYCVTGDFDFGQATGMDRTDYIEENKLCIASLDMFPTLDIYRAICKNEALPESGIPDCVQNFCSRNYIPLFSSITQCVNTMKTDLALGFCKSIVTKLADVDECLEQWNDLGPVETVEQYYNDLALCVPFADLKASPGDCENGVQIQYLKNSTNTWVDFLYIPDNYCGDGSDGTGQIVLSRCDHNELFTNKLRVVQGTGDVSCGPRFQCTAVSGFKQFFSFYRPPTPSPTAFPTLYPTPFPTVPPVCEVKLCETPENYVEINPDNEMLHTKLNGCCVRPPEEVCPEGVIPTIITRSEGSNMSFCGNKYPYSPPYKSSCKSKDKLDLKVMFFREENVTCCETCTCYGDPRCLSFDGTYEEFILCDGRDLPLNNNTEDRCVIRRDQCLKQKDHAANSCTWSNVNADVPDFSDPVQQALAEEKFSVGLYGSPCQVNETLSGRSLVKMYQTDDFELIAVQEERGYIFELNITTARGKYHLDAPNCNQGFDIEVIEKYSPLDDFYVKERFGLEARWIFTDMTTNIEVKFRCTGVENDGRISLPFINVDRLMEPNQTRAERGNGFCSTNHMEGREKSTWQHSETLRQLGVCTSYNLYTTPIILRNSGRAITINPGLSTLGAEWAFTEYCNERYKQGFSTPAKCVKAFMSSKTVVDVFNAFCKTATDKQTTCVNELKAWDITIGYQKGLELSRKKYLETYDQLCSVKPDDHRLNFVADSIGCKPGVELQYHHPTNGWITYKGFPINQAPCNGFEVEFLYKDHKPLFEYPVRLLQSYFPRKCSACDYVSTVDGWFTFSNA